MVSTLAILALLGILAALLFLRRRKPKVGLADSSWVVTGAGSGIGSGLCAELAERGASHLMLIDISQPLLKTRQSELAERFPGTVFEIFEFDVSDELKVSNFGKMMANSGVHLTGLINCAGIVAGKAFDRLELGEIRRVMEVNMLGYAWMIKALMPLLIDRTAPAYIVSIASAMGMLGGARLAPYSASKWANIGFAESLSLEYAISQPQLHFLTVCPYVVDTGMFDGAFAEQNWLAKLLYPILKMEDVATRTIVAIQNCEELILIPGSLGFFIPLLRLLPMALQHWICRMCGAGNGMDTFTGTGAEKRYLQRE